VTQLELDILNTFIANGPFAALFVWLLVYVMKANREREERLQNLLEKFSDKYDVIISELRDIKNKLDE
jgi:cellulose biosynthesis protein BcsQ